MDQSKYTLKKTVAASKAAGDKFRQASMAYAVRRAPVKKAKAPKPKPAPKPVPNPEIDAFDQISGDHFIRMSLSPKLKKMNFGKAAQAVVRFLGITGPTPNANGLAVLVLKHEGKAMECTDRLTAKTIVLDFYERSVSHLVPIKAPKVRHKASVKTFGASAARGRTTFYDSDEWRTVRYVALRASRGVCELCGTTPVKGSPLHVDHIKPRSKYPELELDPTNLQVLCKDCNLGKSNTDEIDWRRPQIS